jgi:hypothetical protein
MTFRESGASLTVLAVARFGGPRLLRTHIAAEFLVPGIGTIVMPREVGRDQNVRLARD